jgi:hypothetical protein
MFARFRQTPHRLQISIVNTHRVGGKVRHEHVASLGSIELPQSVAGRIAFWQRGNERFAELSSRIDPVSRVKIRTNLRARIPIVTPDEQRALQLASAAKERVEPATSPPEPPQIVERAPPRPLQPGPVASRPGDTFRRRNVEPAIEVGAAALFRDDDRFGQQAPTVDDPLDLGAFCAVAANTFGRHHLSPPFRLRDVAAAWASAGIPLRRCLVTIERYLEKHAAVCRSGAGDRLLQWVDQFLRGGQPASSRRPARADHGRR